MVATNARPRSAVTLLEVLISVGVLSVGLLGAATMLPLAKFYSDEASKYDRAAALGQQAYHDMQIRGYLNIKRWTKPQVNAFNYSNVAAFAIDPLAYGYAIANGTPQPQYFPAFPNNGANPPVSGMPMLFRGSIDVSEVWNDASPVQPTAASVVTMPYQMADRIFRSTDDVIFDKPDRPDKRPTTPTGALSPDYQGDFSWFMTLSHLPEDVAADTNNNLSEALGMQRYNVSVVVFHKRQIDLNPADYPGPPTQKEPPPERIVLADFLQPPSFGNQTYPISPDAVGAYSGGGALKLKTISGVGGTNWLDGLKPNQYIMLSVNAKHSTGSAVFPVLAWYRITSVDSGAQVSGGIATRVINVAGSDWPASTTFGGTRIWLDADDSGTGQTGPDTAFCTIADGAVAVYEDVIIVDHSLLRD